ncbi:MORN repeat-containing protein 2-like isoform X3 [Dreissena polymorpha]|uniref:MORN repeat-containing protein 2-like isoform X3 n=1 Tax=Dreissena polymorpha TaxID=45954 RepID=UPI002264A5D9|nr:MORN repeat-containing protein 2-like isoform X3 [Dreissena polymorpha]
MPEHTEEKKGKKVEDTGPVILSGVFVFPNGDRYEGEYIQQDGSIIRSGRGVHSTTDGSVYDGEWADDKMNGVGKLTHHSGAFYAGEFVNNQFHGRGVYTWPNESSYEGDFVENKLEGKGNFTDTEQQTWTGQFRYMAAPGLHFHLRLQ